MIDVFFYYLQYSIVLCSGGVGCGHYRLGRSIIDSDFNASLNYGNTQTLYVQTSYS